MADRFYVGGTGNWNTTGSWSTTSGGASGASVPGSSDNAIFDSASGSFQCTVNTNASCNNLDLTSANSTNCILILFASNGQTLSVSGNVILPTSRSTNILSPGAGAGTMQLVGTGSVTM